MTVATRIWDWVTAHLKPVLTEAEHELAKCTMAGLNYLEKNGGPPLMEFAKEEVLAMSALVTDGPSKALAAQTAIIARLVAAEIPVVLGAVRLAIELAHADLVQNTVPLPDEPPSASVADTQGQ